MPKTVPLGQSFKYLRDQAAKAVPVGGGSGGISPPPGFAFLTYNGEILTYNGEPLWVAS